VIELAHRERQSLLDFRLIKRFNFVNKVRILSERSFLLSKMKTRSINGKRCLARRLVMSSAIGDKEDLKEKAALTNWGLKEVNDQYLINSWLCVNDLNSGERDLQLATQTFIQTSRNQRVLQSTRPSDGLCQSPVATSNSPNSLVYAGARFNESPSPKVLPKPPLHWVGSPKVVDCGAIECVLKVMLRVQC
jgi:hypothetical protein